MDARPIEHVIRSIDRRLERVEQILPTFATKAELREATADATAPLATKTELREAIADATAPLATKAELREAIADAIAPLATRAELHEETERTRRHFDVVAERVEGHIRVIAEGQVALQENMTAQFSEVRTDIAQLDRRVMRLEGAQPA